MEKHSLKSILQLISNVLNFAGLTSTSTFKFRSIKLCDRFAFFKHLFSILSFIIKCVVLLNFAFRQLKHITYAMSQDVTSRTSYVFLAFLDSSPAIFCCVGSFIFVLKSSHKIPNIFQYLSEVENSVVSCINGFTKIKLSIIFSLTGLCTSLTIVLIFDFYLEICALNNPVTVIIHKLCQVVLYSEIIAIFVSFLHLCWVFKLLFSSINHQLSFLEISMEKQNNISVMPVFKVSMHVKQHLISVKIKLLRNLHFKLIKSFADINDLYGFAILCQYIENLFNILFASYNVIQALTGLSLSKTNILSINFMIIFLQLIQAFLYVWIPSLTSKQVRDKG